MGPTYKAGIKLCKQALVRAGLFDIVGSHVQDMRGVNNE